ncbi:hypothetical protein [Frigoriglobus tundricola]|uniref:Uncharacterized protein n=1 Tax=Frigoriglobus tundricola TaxID=2774151 RepID=A0A6M5YI76_9BACT|nr:hypothetical protein [Frigoriglobus tundricola]QJW93789.1 hypothetical protein FTUN_1300 [Frigoriglobus tundricola]
MSTAEVVYVFGSLLTALGVCSLPMLGSLRGAGPRVRATTRRQLGVGWVLAVALGGWLALGWFAIEAGGRWLGTYRDLTLVLMCAFFPLLVVGIRAGKRAAAAARTADRCPPASPAAEPRAAPDPVV